MKLSLSSSRPSKTAATAATLLLGGCLLFPLATELRAAKTPAPAAATTAAAAAAPAKPQPAVKTVKFTGTVEKTIKVGEITIVPKKEVSELKKLISASASKASTYTSRNRDWALAAAAAEKRGKDAPPKDKLDKAKEDFDAVFKKIADHLAKEKLETVKTVEAKGGKGDTKPATIAETECPQDSYLYYTWTRTVEKASSSKKETTVTDGVALVRVAPKLVLRDRGEASLSWLDSYTIEEVTKEKKADAKKGKSGKPEKQTKKGK